MSKKVILSEKTSPAKFGAALDFESTEAYNLLRTNLDFSLVEHEGGKIIGVTSPAPQDGKSFTSINLSYSLAEAGNKVILIDADLRRPSIAKSLKKRVSPGLSNYLLGETDGVIHKSLLSDNLDVIMAGDVPPNPLKLIGSSTMEEALKAFSGIYDYVILDLPPVNSVADPLAVSSFIDGVVLVIRHGVTRRGEVNEAVHQFRFAHATILGFIYNGYDKSSGGYTKKYKYYKNHYYKRQYGYTSVPAKEAKPVEDDSLIGDKK